MSTAVCVAATASATGAQRPGTDTDSLLVVVREGMTKHPRIEVLHFYIYHAPTAFAKPFLIRFLHLEVRLAPAKQSYTAHALAAQGAKPESLLHCNIVLAHSRPPSTLAGSSAAASSDGALIIGIRIGGRRGTNWHKAQSRAIVLQRTVPHGSCICEQHTLSSKVRAVRR